MAKTDIPNGSFPAKRFGERVRYPLHTKGPLPAPEPGKWKPDQGDPAYVQRALDAVDAVMKARPLDTSRIDRDPEDDEPTA